MSKWIRNNLVLLAGIILPLLLVAVFFILSKAPSLLTEPPAYDFVLVAYRYDHQHPRDYYLSFEVRNGTLHGKVTPADDQHVHLNRQYAGIFRYNMAANRFDEISYDLPAGLEDLDKAFEFAVKETRQLKLDKRTVSPDGFSFENLGYRRRGGVLGEIFGMNNARYGEFSLSKDSAYFILPRLASNPYYNSHDVRFMGWIVADGESQ